MKLRKSKTDRVLFGVCGGIGKFTGVDSALIRLLFVVGTIFSGSILLWIYLILGLVLSVDDQ
jgi:phage shock protein PspC (stress-responsive transcriptional regulator)